jgi:hypothetical protein
VIASYLFQRGPDDDLVAAGECRRGELLGSKRRSFAAYCMHLQARATLGFGEGDYFCDAEFTGEGKVLS